MVIKTVPGSGVFQVDVIKEIPGPLIALHLQRYFFLTTHAAAY